VIADARGWRPFVVLCACCLAALAACSSPGHTANGKIRVVAGENFWGDFAAQIGGDRVSVTSIIRDPSTDPHEYEADVHTAAALAGARLVIENGLGYDDFLRKLLSASPARHRTTLVVADVVGVAGRNANPHLWYGPAYATRTARAIEVALAKAAPDYARMFQANLARFLAGERRVVDIVNRIKTRYAGTKVAYTERVPGYLLDAAGLRLGTPAAFSQSIEDGNDPSPADNAGFERALTDHTVKVLIYNAQVSDPATKHLRDLAIRSGVPVVGMTETMPPEQADYQTWQADQAAALLAALDG
jgi:zinc/manganese transport system substrate-binding protein